MDFARAQSIQRRSAAKDLSERRRKVAAGAKYYGPTQCHCGLVRTKGHVVCLECWKVCNHRDKQDLRSPDPIIRANAIRNLIATAEGRAYAARQLQTATASTH